jgi:hypothetical protein
MFNKLSDYFQRKAAEDANERFMRQLKGSFLSTAIIIAVVFALIIIIVVISAVSSIFS